MEGYEKNDGMEMNDRDEIYSKPVRAGKRTYFFDVKATRNNDYYLTITESKKKLEKDGSQNYEKHKIFLYTLNPQLHSRSATYIKRNELLIRKTAIKSSHPFQYAYHPLTP